MNVICHKIAQYKLSSWWLLKALHMDNQKKTYKNNFHHSSEWWIIFFFLRLCPSFFTFYIFHVEISWDDKAILTVKIYYIKLNWILHTCMSSRHRDFVEVDSFRLKEAIFTGIFLQYSIKFTSTFIIHDGGGMRRVKVE